MQGFFVAAALSMEAIVTGEFDAIRMELKYCEACGALCLRPESSSAPYCRRCEKVMAGLARVSAPEGTQPAERKQP